MDLKNNEIILIDDNSDLTYSVKGGIEFKEFNREVICKTVKRKDTTIIEQKFVFFKTPYGAVRWAHIGDFGLNRKIFLSKTHRLQGDFVDRFLNVNGS